MSTNVTIITTFPRYRPTLAERCRLKQRAFHKLEAGRINRVRYSCAATFANNSLGHRIILSPNNTLSNLPAQFSRETRGRIGLISRLMNKLRQYGSISMRSCSRIINLMKVSLDTMRGAVPSREQHAFIFISAVSVIEST